MFVMTSFLPCGCFGAPHVIHELRVVSPSWPTRQFMGGPGPGESVKAASIPGEDAGGLWRAVRYLQPAQLGPGPDSELAIHPGQVCFDGAPPHEQLGGDLWVRVALGDQVGHALLGGGED